MNLIDDKITSDMTFQSQSQFWMDIWHIQWVESSFFMVVMVSSSFWMLFFHPIRIHSWRAIHPIPTGHLCGGVGRPCKEANAGEFKDPGGLLQHTADGAPRCPRRSPPWSASQPGTSRSLGAPCHRWSGKKGPCWNQQIGMIFLVKMGFFEIRFRKF